MGYIAIFIIGVVLGMILLSITTTSEINDLMEENQYLYNENKELSSESNHRRNAETRAMNYARLIKKIEDITTGKGYGSIVDRFDQIKKLVTDGKSEN